MTTSIVSCIQSLTLPRISNIDQVVGFSHDTSKLEKSNSSKGISSARPAKMAPVTATILSSTKFPDNLNRITTPKNTNADASNVFRDPITIQHHTLSVVNYNKIHHNIFNFNYICTFPSKYTTICMFHIHLFYSIMQQSAS